MKKPVKFVPAFVRTKNVRNFEVMMESLKMAEGEGRFGMVWSEAGRGKSRTTEWWHAHHESTYVKTKYIWRTSELEFLWDLANELRVTAAQRRKGAVFTQIVEKLTADPRPVFIDEIERMPRGFLEICRDLTNMTGAPFVLIGEDELVSFMQQNRRVWSRTYQHLHFEPVATSDIIYYIKETTGLAVSTEVAAVLEKGGIPSRMKRGNFRIVKRAVLALVQIVNSEKNSTEVTMKMAKDALKFGLSGN